MLVSKLRKIDYIFDLLYNRIRSYILKNNYNIKLRFPVI